ncbi:MAG: Hsp20/alpha crystallin family protein [Candidatus Aenigmarchaeota archaeon]|nr:Hsp20/alpha crystallin family protein [Candidatus Aenigmarchaeota archaeon]
MTKKNKKSKKYPLWFEDPYERIRKTEEEFHKLMSDFWKDPFEFKFTFPKMEFDIKGIKPIPVTISEDNKKIYIKAELPGFKKDEITVNLTDRTLEISANRKQKLIDKGKTFYKQEASYKSARRLITLPSEVDVDSAKTKFQHGILEIEVNKVKTVRKKKKLKID